MIEVVSSSKQRSERELRKDQFPSPSPEIDQRRNPEIEESNNLSQRQSPRVRRRRGERLKVLEAQTARVQIGSLSRIETAHPHKMSRWHAEEIETKAQKVLRLIKSLFKVQEKSCTKSEDDTRRTRRVEHQRRRELPIKRMEIAHWIELYLTLREIIASSLEPSERRTTIL